MAGAQKKQIIPLENAPPSGSSSGTRPLLLLAAVLLFAAGGMQIYRILTFTHRGAPAEEQTPSSAPFSNLFDIMSKPKPLQKDTSTSADQTNGPTSIPIRAHNPTIGPEDADETVIIFTDTSCGQCRGKVAATLANIRSQNATGHTQHIIYKFLPATPNAVQAGVFDQLARRYQVFPAYIKALARTGTRNLTAEDHIAALEASGIPLKTIRTALKENMGPLLNILKEDVADADLLSLTTSPPHIFLNGKSVK